MESAAPSWRSASRGPGPDELTAVVNTADDFEHLGLHISPDLDTVMYALAGLEDPDTGWGHRDETWGFMGALEALGGETWFRLGDRDLATHIERTRRLAQARRCPASPRRCGGARRRHAIMPMSDDPVRTLVVTEEGGLEFQHYFVRRRCEPEVRAIRFEGADGAHAAPAALAALDDPRWRRSSSVRPIRS